MSLPVTFDTHNMLIKYFQKNGTEVGPRYGLNKRTKDQKEMYNLRQYLLTLASNDLIGYPLKIEGGESPDFIIVSDDQKIGLEITEATTPRWQKQLTQTDIELNGKKFGTLQPLNRDGWVANSAERDTCAAILWAILKKVRKIRKGIYRKVSSYDLLIYVNVRSFFYDEKEVADLLSDRVSRWLSERAKIETVKVHVITASNLLFDVTENMKILPLSTAGEDF